MSYKGFLHGFKSLHYAVNWTNNPLSQNGRCVVYSTDFSRGHFGDFSSLVITYNAEGSVLCPLSLSTFCSFFGRGCQAWRLQGQKKQPRNFKIHSPVCKYLWSWAKKALGWLTLPHLVSICMGCVGVWGLSWTLLLIFPFCLYDAQLKCLCLYTDGFGALFFSGKASLLGNSEVSSAAGDRTKQGGHERTDLALSK